VKYKFKTTPYKHQKQAIEHGVWKTRAENIAMGSKRGKVEHEVPL
jgi:hypothetical protein